LLSIVEALLLHGETRPVTSLQPEQPRGFQACGKDCGEKCKAYRSLWPDSEVHEESLPAMPALLLSRVQNQCTTDQRPTRESSLLFSFTRPECTGAGCPIFATALSSLRWAFAKRTAVLRIRDQSDGWNVSVPTSQFLWHPCIEQRRGGAKAASSERFWTKSEKLPTKCRFSHLPFLICCILSQYLF
jgi:hypothetical protein